MRRLVWLPLACLAALPGCRNTTPYIGEPLTWGDAEWPGAPVRLAALRSRPAVERRRPPAAQPRAFARHVRLDGRRADRAGQGLDGRAGRLAARGRCDLAGRVEQRAFGVVAKPLGERAQRSAVDAGDRGDRGRWFHRSPRGVDQGLRAGRGRLRRRRDQPGDLDERWWGQRWHHGHRADRRRGAGRGRQRDLLGGRRRRRGFQL